MNQNTRPSTRFSSGSVFTLVAALLTLSAVSVMSGAVRSGGAAESSAWRGQPWLGQSDSQNGGMSQDEMAMYAIRSSLSQPVKFVWGFEAGGWRALSLKI